MPPAQPGCWDLAVKAEDGGRHFGVLLPALPLPQCVTPGKSLSPSVPLLAHVQNLSGAWRDITNYQQQRCFESLGGTKLWKRTS